MRKATLFFIASIYLFVFFIASPKMLGDPDTAWHIAAGELIIENKSIPTFDTWSYTTYENFKWYNLSWSWDIIAFKLYKLDPYYLIIASIVIYTIVVLLLASASKSGSLRDLSIIIASVLILLGYAGSINVRPHMISFLFIALVYFIISLVRTAGRHKLMFILPIIFLIWSNLHGGFIAGFVFLGFYIIELLLTNKTRQLYWTLLVMLLSVAVTLINPYGIEIYEGVLRSLSSELKPFIKEWQSVVSDPTIVSVVFLIMTIVSFLIVRRKFNYFDKLLFIFWLIAGISSKRHIAIFSLVSFPFLAYGVEAFFRKFAWSDKLSSNIEFDIGSKKLARICSICFVLTCFLIIFGRSLVFPEGVLFKKSIAPEECIEFVIENHPEKRFFTHYNYGGYIALKTKGAIKTFIDSRAETAYQDTVIQDAISFNYNPDLRPEIIKRYNIEGLLLTLDDKRILTENPNQWHVVFSGEDCFVAVNK
jgi:hypothetical protein